MAENQEPVAPSAPPSVTGAGAGRAFQLGEPGGRGAEPGAHGSETAGLALATELSDRVIAAVDWARARATVRLLKALRAVVYGFVAAVALVTAAVLATIGVVRVWDAYVPVYPLGTRVWLGYVIFGAVLFFPGVWLLNRRRASGRA